MEAHWVVVVPVVVVLVVWYARDQIRYGVMTTGTLMAFLYALFKVYEPVKRLGGIYHQFQQALGATCRFALDCHAKRLQ